MGEGAVWKGLDNKRVLRIVSSNSWCERRSGMKRILCHPGDASTHPVVYSVKPETSQEPAMAKQVWAFRRGKPPMKWWDQMPWSSFSECWALSQLFHSPLSLSSRGFWVPFCHKGGVICISEVIDISPGNLDFSLCFFQSSVSHDVLCI